MEENNSNGTLELGGNINLTGFSEFDGGTMIILKKIIGNHVKKLAELSNNFETLHITSKPIHHTHEEAKKFEVKAKVIDNGKVYNTETVERNIFVAIDNVLKKLDTVMDR